MEIKFYHNNGQTIRDLSIKCIIGTEIGQSGCCHHPQPVQQSHTTFDYFTNIPLNQFIPAPYLMS